MNAEFVSKIKTSWIHEARPIDHESDPFLTVSRPERCSCCSQRGTHLSYTISACNTALARTANE